jgi:hypothetical protein
MRSGFRWRDAAAGALSPTLTSPLAMMRLELVILGIITRTPDLAGSNQETQMGRVAMNLVQLVRNEVI